MNHSKGYTNNSCNTQNPQNCPPCYNTASIYKSSNLKFASNTLDITLEQEPCSTTTIVRIEGTGPTGPQGPRGWRGYQGHTGEQGKRGWRGYPGATGPTGPAAPNSPTVVTTTTTNNNLTTIATIPTLTDNTYLLNIEGIAQRTDAGTNSATYFVKAGYRNNSGTVTRIGVSDNKVEFEDDAGWDVLTDISGTNIIIQVLGVSGATIDWKISYREMHF